MPWTYGIHPVESLLQDAPETVQELWLVQSRRPGDARTRVLDVARELGVRFRMVTDAQLRGAVGEVTHQGVAARVLEFNYTAEQELLAMEGPGLLVVLDEIQDPHNLGSILRSAAAWGARGVVIPRHRAATVTAAVSKVAAGAASRVPVARVVNLVRFLEQARTAGYWTYGAVVGEGTTAWNHDWADRSILVLGSEGKGLRPAVKSACDLLVTLPMETIESVNVSVAAGVLMYEWRRFGAKKPVDTRK
jgi:23S rRNA (guanosine2251-2'-O)-methyltransferase